MAADALLQIRVTPRARRNALGGMEGGVLAVRLAAPPVEGAANDALIEFLAASLRLPRRDIRIVSGGHSRRKRVAIAGMTPAQVRAILGH